MVEVVVRGEGCRWLLVLCGLGGVNQGTDELEEQVDDGTLGQVLVGALWSQGLTHITSQKRQLVCGGW